MPEDLQTQDWVIRAGVVVVIAAFIVGWVLKRFTRSGQHAEKRAAQEEASAIRCEKCGYYLVPSDTSCPKCGQSTATI